MIAGTRWPCRYEKDGVGLKQFFVYVVAILGSSLLLGFSERWEGYEWQYALLVVGLFAVSVKGWERLGLSSIGLVFITAYGLFMVNSILYYLRRAS